MLLRLAVFAVIAGFASAQAAAEELPVVREPGSAHMRYSAIGMASWYGSEFHGHPTADGEKFDMRSLSAAHRTLPLPCYARVTNLGNGRSVIVRVNDRGPFVGGRLLDVSARVAGLLEFNHLGITKIRLDYIGKAPPAGSDGPALMASLRTANDPMTAAAPAPVKLAVAVAAAKYAAGTLAVAAPAFAPSAPPAPAVAAIAKAAAAAESPPRAAVNSAEADSVPRAGGAEADGGVTVITRVSAPAPTAEARSPYGELVVFPFLAQLGKSVVSAEAR